MRKIKLFLVLALVLNIATSLFAQEPNQIVVAKVNDTDFTILAKKHSIAPSATRGGDLGFIQKGQKSSLFDSVAFSEALKVGKLSQIFQTSEGYCILKLKEIVDERQILLAEIEDDIKQQMLFFKKQQTVGDLIYKIASKVKIEIYEDNIK